MLWVRAAAEYPTSYGGNPPNAHQQQRLWCNKWQPFTTAELGKDTMQGLSEEAKAD